MSGGAPVRPAVAVLINEGAYGVLDAMAQNLASAFERLGARVIRVDSDFARARSTDENVMRDIRLFKPDLLVGMNLAGQGKVDGRWLPEHFDAPFVTWIVDHPAYFMNAHSPLYGLRAHHTYYVACVDPMHIPFLRRFYPERRLFFLPHASVDARENPVAFQGREPAAVLSAGIGRPIPGAAIRRDAESADESGSWLRRACRIVHNTTLIDIGIDAFEQIESQLRAPAFDTIEALTLPIAAFEEVESRVRQEARRTMVARIADSGVCRVDVYGDEGWRQSARPDGSVRYLGPLEYRNAPVVIARYRYALNPQPTQNRNGSHERVMDALSAGTLPITLTNEFYRTEFGDNIVHARIRADSIEINAASEDDYDRRLKSARGVFSSRHTWAARAAYLLDRFCGSNPLDGPAAA